jgi:hypothetical protein
LNSSVAARTYKTAYGSEEYRQAAEEIAESDPRTAKRRPKSMFRKITVEIAGKLGKSRIFRIRATKTREVMPFTYNAIRESCAIIAGINGTVLVFSHTNVLHA